MTISLADFSRYTYSTGYLLHLGFSTPIRLCTNRTVTTLGYTWAQGDFTISDVAETTIGPQSLKITLGDTRFTYSQTFLNEWARGIACDLYLVYFLDSVKTEQIFAGELLGPVIGNDIVEATAGIARYGKEQTPRIPFTSDYSISRGDEITIGSVTYVIE